MLNAKMFNCNDRSGLLDQINYYSSFDCFIEDVNRRQDYEIFESWLLILWNWLNLLKHCFLEWGYKSRKELVWIRPNNSNVKNKIENKVKQLQTLADRECDTYRKQKLFFCDSHALSALIHLILLAPRIAKVTRCAIVLFKTEVRT